MIRLSESKGAVATTGTEIVLPASGTVRPIRTLSTRALSYIRAAKSEHTRAAYKTDWEAFESWCGRMGMQALPTDPATLIEYLSYLALDQRVSTIGRKMVSIAIQHKAHGYPSPTTDAQVREMWQGIRNTLGTAAAGKAPILIEDLRRMMEIAPRHTQGWRDRALLLIGFAGAFRRSELVGLEFEDVSFVTEGVEVLLRRSKTDQEGAGRKVAIPYGSRLDTCPVRTLQTWIEVSRITGGPLFRAVNKGGTVGREALSDKAVARIVKKYVEAIGLDPKRYGGHSLRAGLATAAAKAGAPEPAIMKQTGHKSVEMVRRYVRDGNLWRDNAATYVGL